MADDDVNDAGVGYGRPPKASQFKKGQSGNAKGRPPKARGKATIAARVLSEVQRLAGQPKGARVRYTMLEIIVMTLKQLTAAGHDRAAALYMRFAARFGRQQMDSEQVGYLVVPGPLTKEEWIAKYAPKDDPPDDPDLVD